MAGGKGSRFSMSKATSYGSSSVRSGSSLGFVEEASKEFHSLNIPSERSILEIIINRFIALSENFNCSIILYLGVSPDKIEDLTSKIFTLTDDKEKLVMYLFVHKVMGALDMEGKLVI